MVTFIYRRTFPAWKIYVPTHNQQEEDANSGGVEGSYSFGDTLCPSMSFDPLLSARTETRVWDIVGTTCQVPPLKTAIKATVL